MASGLLEPLAVFCSQSQSQRYIKAARNLGDSWRSLAEKPLSESEKDFVLVETNFDFVLKITNILEEQRQSEPSIVEMSAHEPSTPLLTVSSEPSLSTKSFATPLSTGPSTSTEPPRHYRIFADYGTAFIWRDPDDLRPEEGDCMLEAGEVLSTFPSSVLELFNAWVDTYTDNFSERRDKTQNYYADVFLTTSEEVAWNVAGFLLAWRITLAPQVGRIEFSAGCSKYILEKGMETRATLQFLQDQVDILAKGKPVT
ncbi:hypothetical protein N7519_000977 [Penicillium mononematosum]|uniref:uncharacterized protein n=1 Tax=Penicillium mononematosum TaxID=268346 RepID=UPI0025481CB0|nr:uncharacterized protein N7519_000977 [Penicillium mononematosum]KAJ6190956.1 hypothetical protein N7519_000977 [Penicillium mononematosum]